MFFSIYKKEKKRPARPLGSRVRSSLPIQKTPGNSAFAGQTQGSSLTCGKTKIESFSGIVPEPAEKINLGSLTLKSSMSKSFTSALRTSPFFFDRKIKDEKIRGTPCKKKGTIKNFFIFLPPIVLSQSRLLIHHRRRRSTESIFESLRQELYVSRHSSVFSVSQYQFGIIYSFDAARNSILIRFISAGSTLMTLRSKVINPLI